MSEKVEISFPESKWPAVLVPAGENLSESLDANNSPLLFGCRTGICGTCVVEVEEDNDLPPVSQEEAQILSVYAPNGKNVRLACQLAPTEKLSLKRMAE